MENNYTAIIEDLLKAVEIVAQSKVDQIQFDKTEICTIIDASKRDDGQYTVTTGSINFEAYSESTKYRKNDTVRVTIPNGDYSKKKYIEGKYVTDNNMNPIAYVSPSDSVVDVAENLIKTNETFSIKSNEETLEKCIWSIDIANSPYADFQQQGLYDVLLLKANFKCLLSNYNVIQGHYGLRLDFYIETPNAKQYSKKQVFLDTEDMFGNPYSYNIYTLQEKKIDIKSLGNIKVIGLFLYQKKDFEYFKDKGKKLIPLPIGDNIFVKDLFLSFGNDLSNIADNTVKLVTKSSPTYKLNGEETDNEKVINLLWYNKSPENKYLGYSDGIVDRVYDEIAYIQKNNRNIRMQTQMGKEVPQDESGLTLGADKEEIIQLLKELNALTGKDLFSKLIAFKESLSPLGETQLLEKEKTVNKIFEELLSGENSIGVASNEFVTISEDINDYYSENLLNAYKLLELKEEVSYIATDKNFITSIQTAFKEKIKKPLETFLQDLEKLIQVHTSFSSIYDWYSPQINKLIESIDDTQEKVIILLNNDELQNFFVVNYNYVKYIIPEDEDNNKYCIYWYRYEKGYYDSAEPFLEEEWKRIDIQNYGLPLETENGYYVARPNIKDNSFTFMANGELPIEKYRVVLFYNHEMFLSNILEFTNEDNTLSNLPADLTDAIYLEHGKNSQDSYQSYGANNYLINAADAYTKREIKLSFNGKKLKESDLIGAQIFWYIPNNSTMLTYNIKNFENYTNDLKNSEDEALPQSEHFKSGFTCFYKTFTEEDKTITYGIEKYYIPTANRNTIYCKILKDELVFQAEITFVFSTFGTSGTDYTLVVHPQGFQTAVEQNKELDLAISLYDYNNKKLNLTTDTTGDGRNTKISWFDGYSKYSSILLDKNNKVTGAKIIYGNAINNYPGIIQVETTVQVLKNKNINLTTLYPIPYSATNEEFDYYIEGATTVVYDSMGSNPIYYKDPYKIFRSDTNEEITENITWIIENHGKSQNSTLVNSFIPSLDSKNRLVPSNFYLTIPTGEAQLQPVVICKQGEKIIWAQPIILMQNRYASNMLNSWDGSFEINEENGTIMSTMIGAGKKDSNNTFSGILMGDISNVSNEDNGSGIGIYGFHEGAQSFAFMNDGTGFIGKSGHGRIYFDGNQSQIRSAAWSQTKNAAGMCIDLDDGWIDMKGAKKNEDGSYNADGTQSHVRIDVKDPYFQIKSVNGNELIHIGSNEYYMQTDNFSNDNKTGLQFDLKAGDLIGYRFLLTAYNTNNLENIRAIMIDSDDSYYPFQIGSSITDENEITRRTFAIGWDGSIHTPGFYVDSSGAISATSGYIGGWRIDQNSIYSNSAKIELSSKNDCINIKSGSINLYGSDSILNFVASEDDITKQIGLYPGYYKASEDSSGVFCLVVGGKYGLGSLGITQNLYVLNSIKANGINLSTALIGSSMSICSLPSPDIITLKINNTATTLNTWIEGKISPINTKLTDLDSTVTELTNNITALEKNINSIETALDSYYESWGKTLTKHEERILSLEARNYVTKSELETILAGYVKKDPNAM